MKSARSSRGYSIVELVVTIVVVGIVAAVGISRLLSADAYDVITAREQIVSVLRTAQQRAIGHSNVLVTLQSSGNDLVINLETGADNLMAPVTTTVPAGALRADINIVDSCNTPPHPDNTLTDVKPLHIEFDSLGNLLRGGVVDGNPAYPADITSGVRICLNNDPDMSICISAAGFPYAGDCDE